MTTEAAKTIRVLLVEDHTLVREGTKALLHEERGITVVGEADNADDALRLAQELLPDVVLLDIRLKRGSGIDVARALHRDRIPCRVLVLSSYDYEQYITAMARAGVSGYVLKDVPPRDLIQAIHQVHEGNGVLPGNIAATVLASISRRPRETYRPPDALTVREVQVLELVMQDLRSAQIAERTSLSPRTIDAHIANILGKLGASSRAEAVKIALDRGYLSHRA